MDGGAWWATVHGFAKSWTQLSNFTFTFCHTKGGRAQNKINFILFLKINISSRILKDSGRIYARKLY